MVVTRLGGGGALRTLDGGGGVGSLKRPARDGRPEGRVRVRVRVRVCISPCAHAPVLLPVTVIA